MQLYFLDLVSYGDTQTGVAVFCLTMRHSVNYNILITLLKNSSTKLPIRIDNMIIHGKTKPEVLLADMSWWKMITNSPPKIYQDYELLCPTIFYAEIYHDIKSANKRFKTPYEVIGILPWQLLVKNELEGKEILYDSITPFHLKAEQNMDSEEEHIRQKSQNIIRTFDKHDQQTFQSGKVSSLQNLNHLGNFGNAPHQNLTEDQFWGKNQIFQSKLSF